MANIFLAKSEQNIFIFSNRNDSDKLLMFYIGNLNYLNLGS